MAIPIQALLPDTFVVSHSTLHIFCGLTPCANDTITVRERAAERPRLEYSLDLDIGRSREDLIALLSNALSILDRLPDDGSLADIAAAMGTDLPTLEV